MTKDLKFISTWVEELDYERCLNPWVFGTTPEADLHPYTMVQICDSKGKIFEVAYDARLIDKSVYRDYKIIKYRIMKV